MDIKQEDLIKFWTWCGFKKEKHDYKVKDAYKEPPYSVTHYWKSPEGKSWRTKPPLTLSLIYQYAIPKLQDKGWDVCLYAVKEKRFKVSIERRSTLAIKTESDNPTDALYRAILAVIDKETE